MVKLIVMASLSLFVISILAIIAFQFLKKGAKYTLALSYVQGGVGLLACFEALAVLLAKFIYV